MTLGPDAVLWDMDGTIVDTEHYFLAAVEEIIAADGGTWNAGNSGLLVGANLWVLAGAVIDSGVERAPADIIDDILARVTSRVREHIPWRPGAMELLQDLRKQNVTTALVTMSFRSLAEEIVAAIPFDAFDVLVTGDDVNQGKPDPEAYLKAAHLLGVDIRKCTVIEDSPPGVAAAVASGASVVAVPLHVDLPQSTAYSIWGSLTDKDIRDIREVHCHA
jgi:HAD superfamily hydrolase (TIGR01509 family)